jgi:hypothetical protein
MKCPKCLDTNENYIRLSEDSLEKGNVLLKLIPFKKKYLCLACGKTYFTLFGFKIAEFD